MVEPPIAIKKAMEQKRARPSSKRVLHETRQRVREILGKPLKWRLVPIRIEPEVYEKLRRLAPDGDVAKLLKETVERLLLVP